MEKSRSYEKYPYWIIFISSFVSIATYLLGALIIYRAGFSWLVIYLLYVLLLEARLLKKSCVDCYYYGKQCAFGKGKLSCLFFNKGNPKNFVSRKITWKDIIPDFMVSVVPLILGVSLLITDFEMFLLLQVVLLVLFAFVGSAFVRSSLACKHCRQREIGCPAEQLFKAKK